jgi:two-component system nitrate/nitrite response regulator NarL
MSGQTRRFIIADDDPESRFFVQRILLKLYPDATIAEAGSGEEALELCEWGGADLMIIDHKMPMIDGTALVRELRERQVAIPLVVISDLPQAKDAALKAGATLFLDKDRLMSDLGNSLQAILAKT